MIDNRFPAALAALLFTASVRAGDFCVDPVQGNDASAGSGSAARWRMIFHASVVLRGQRRSDPPRAGPGFGRFGRGLPDPARRPVPARRPGWRGHGHQGGPDLLETFGFFSPRFPPVWVREVRGAMLRGAMLRGAMLRGAMLRGAMLRGAMLRGAMLRGATGAAFACRAQPVLRVDCTIENSTVGSLAETGSSSSYVCDLSPERVHVSGCGTGLRVHPEAKLDSAQIRERSEERACCDGDSKPILRCERELRRREQRTLIRHRSTRLRRSAQCGFR